MVSIHIQFKTISLMETCFRCACIHACMHMHIHVEPKLELTKHCAYIRTYVHTPLGVLTCMHLLYFNMIAVYEFHHHCIVRMLFVVIGVWLLSILAVDVVISHVYSNFLFLNQFAFYLERKKDECKCMCVYAEQEQRDFICHFFHGLLVCLSFGSVTLCSVHVTYSVLSQQQHHKHHTPFALQKAIVYISAHSDIAIIKRINVT